MASINTRGVIVGGLVAGLIINISESILNVPVLGEEMGRELTAHSLPPVGNGAVAVFVAFGFLTGIVLVWLYAAMRPRFGAGPKTAAMAGLVVWFLDYFAGSVVMVTLGFFSMPVASIALVWGLVELIVAGLVGGRLYSEG